jgi:hypothetical protein
MITWITPAGSLGILTERVLQDILLSATSSIGDITFEVISGSLPRGLRLINGHITGSPVEVKRWTIKRFVIRASDGIDLEDRTFSLAIDGADVPQWITREGYLNVGQGDAYFILDNSYVNFQLTAYDTDLTAGDILEYYLVPMGGELPPGLSLASDGVISGFTDPVFAVEYNGTPDGSYDTSSYDTMPLDVVRTNSNGFDTYFYDNVTYDYSDNSRTPRRLSRSYTFAIAVTDGANTINRIFKIYVVTEEFLQADNNILQVDTNLFQADASRDRLPLWITESYIGRLRANNYITLFLDVYDPPSLEGTITYFLLNTNPGSYKLASTSEVITDGRYEISGKFPQFKYAITGEWSSTKNYLVGDVVEYSDDSGFAVLWVCQNPHINRRPGTGNFWNRKIFTSTGTFVPDNPTSWLVVYPETLSVVPPGMELDSITGEITGRVPYQAAVTKNYKFTLLAVNFPNTLSNQNYNLVGDWSSTTYYNIHDAVRYEGFIYVCIKANSSQVVSDTTYWILGVASSEKTFSLDLIGEIESSIEWLTDSDLGSIKPNQPSYISITAKSLLYGGRVSYELISGELPPGLTFLPTGDIQGKVKQFADTKGLGLTRFFDHDSSTIDSTASISFTLSFDGAETTFDKKYSFTVKAKDSVNFAEITKTFYINVIADNTKTFANLYVKAFQPKTKRLTWYDFITDATIFKPNDMYRYGDPNFGIQTDLKMLVFAGIESTQAVTYVQAMSRNHYRKRLLFGNVQYAKARDPITQEILYEVVYTQLIDSFEKNGVSISNTIELPDNINSPVLISYDSIKIDSDIPLVSDRDHQRVFPNSIKNMRKRIQGVGDRDREFLPLWMRSIQDQANRETGYVKALTLCYSKPGTAEGIIARIKANGFDFKTIDFVADRYLIDILDGEIEDKYLAFPQRGEKLP